MLQFETAIGTCGLTWNDVGLTGVFLPGDRELKRPTQTGADATQLPPPSIVAARDGICALLSGEPADLSQIPLDHSLVDGLQAEVLSEIRRLAPGELTTYGEIARALGRPNDARAVGAALGRNPWPIVVPCHRVLAADGSLHGFSAPGGIATKRKMLEIERAPGFDQPSLFA